MQAYTAASIYGMSPLLQPTANSMAGHVGQVEPSIRTAPFATSAANPTVWIVGLLGVAIGLIHFSVGMSLGK